MLLSGDVRFRTVIGSAAIGAKRAEDALTEREARLRSILETATDAIIVIDQGRLINWFSPAAERLFGWTEAETLGRSVTMLMPSPVHELEDEDLAHYFATGKRRVTGFGQVTAGLRKDSSTFPLELSVGEFRLEGRRLFTGIVHDVTRQKKAERRIQDLQSELMHVSRLNVTGQMGTALAHELNQPLSAIINYVQAARYFLEARGSAVPSRVFEAMEKAASQAKRAGQVIQHLRQFVEKGQTDRHEEDINEVVGEASVLALVGANERRIEVRMELDADAAPVLIDRIQVQQVVLNLVRNAVEAMSTVERRELTIRTAVDEAGNVEVSVRDTGPGIPPDVAAKLFRPFVTTKRNGMGIGLSICRSIVESHGGDLSAAPNPDGGTIFRFAVPHAVPAGDHHDPAADDLRRR